MIRYAFIKKLNFPGHRFLTHCLQSALFSPVATARRKGAATTRLMVSLPLCRRSTRTAVSPDSKVARTSPECGRGCTDCRRHEPFLAHQLNLFIVSGRFVN